MASFPQIIRYALLAFGNLRAAQRVGDRVRSWKRAGALLALAGLIALLAITVLLGVAWLTLSRWIRPDYAGLILFGILTLAAAILVGLAHRALRDPTESGRKPSKPSGNNRASGDAPFSAERLVEAVRPYIGEIVTAAVVAGLLVGRRRSR